MEAFPFKICVIFKVHTFLYILDGIPVITYLNLTRILVRFKFVEQTTPNFATAPAASKNSF